MWGWFVVVSAASGLQVPATGPATILIGLEGRQERGFRRLEDSLSELEELARVAELSVVDRVTCRRGHEDEAVDAAGMSLIEARVRSAARHAQSVACLFDEELTPEQQRKLERKLQVEKFDDVFRDPSKKVDKKQRAMERQNAQRSFGYDKHSEIRDKRRDASSAVVVRVMDRTAVVLELFSRRATTAEGRLQVALATTIYRTPRLTKYVTRVDELGEQLGSTKEERRRTMENDQKVLKQRAATLRRRIAELKEHRERTRHNRVRAGLPVVALVGYANAGKSSVMEALTLSEATVDDKPFATLDPLARRVRLGRDGPFALVVDTVGFVSKLPAQLTAAFRATLEEVKDADLIVHVVDASAPKRLVADRERIVKSELEALGVADTPRLIFYNKLDDRQQALDFPAPAGSAKMKHGMEDLRKAMLADLFDNLTTALFCIPWANPESGALIADLKKQARVLKEAHDDRAAYFRAALPEGGSLAAKLRPFRVQQQRSNKRQKRSTTTRSSSRRSSSTS